jgi:hypothetical protein
VALADQAYLNDVAEATGLHQRNTVLQGTCRGRHDGNWGDGMWGKEETFCTPCPYGSGYKRVEDPLSLEGHQTV